MATTTFNTRISLKYDTYAQWVEKDPQLLVGEVAVVVVPAETGAVAKEPAVLFKVGDGAHKFSELQFTAGLAAGVRLAAGAAEPCAGGAGFPHYGDHDRQADGRKNAAVRQRLGGHVQRGSGIRPGHSGGQDLRAECVFLQKVQGHH